MIFIAINQGCYKLGWVGRKKIVDQNDTHRGLPQLLGMPKMHSGKEIDGKILIGAYISDLKKWWQFLKVEFFIIYMWSTEFQQKINRFSKNMCSLEIFCPQLEFWSNRMFSSKHVMVVDTRQSWIWLLWNTFISDPLLLMCYRSWLLIWAIVI